MWWVPGVKNSVCPGNDIDSTHAYGASYYNYSIYNGSGYNGSTNPQGNWAWCNLCQSLFWGVSGSYCSGSGVNPGNGNHYNHSVGSSTNYNLNYGDTGGLSDLQPNWHWCVACHSLFYPKAGTLNGGVCNNSQYTTHVGGGTNYAIWWYSTL